MKPYSYCVLMDMEHFDISRLKYLVIKTQGNFEYEASAFHLLILYSPHMWRVAHVWSVQ